MGNGEKEKGQQTIQYTYYAKRCSLQGYTCVVASLAYQAQCPNNSTAKNCGTYRWVFLPLQP